MAAVPSQGRAVEVAREAELTRALYEEYAPQILRYCLHQLGSREEAEDAVQSTFLNAFRGIKRGVVPELESAWLFKIAHNVCLSRRRSTWRRGRIEAPTDFDVVEELAPAPSRRADELIGLQDVLEQMPEQQRRAILLREWQGLSYREIGDELELSQAAVETLIFRARRSLAQGLEQPETVQRRRSRRLGASLFGNLLSSAQSFLVGGSAAAVKVAATVAVVSAGTVVATAPVEHHVHHVHPTAPAHAGTSSTSTPQARRTSLPGATAPAAGVAVPAVHRHAVHAPRATAASGPLPTPAPEDPASVPAATTTVDTPPPASAPAAQPPAPPVATPPAVTPSGATPTGATPTGATPTVPPPSSSGSGHSDHERPDKSNATAQPVTTTPAKVAVPAPANPFDRGHHTGFGDHHGTDGTTTQPVVTTPAATTPAATTPASTTPVSTTPASTTPVSTTPTATTVTTTPAPVTTEAAVPTPAPNLPDSHRADWGHGPHR
ncbi:MAG: sigma-70 family RNA polymerase sigma factor [Actinomycetota bacterium]